MKRQRVERETHTRESGYLKYRNNYWKGKRAGRLDGAKECRHSLLCLQEIKWKGSKVRNNECGCKLFYNGADERRNGVGIVVREKLVQSVLEVKRVSDNSHETGGKRVDPKHSKRVCSTG